MIGNAAIRRLLAAAREYRRARAAASRGLTLERVEAENRADAALHAAALALPFAATKDEAAAPTLDPHGPECLANATLLWLAAEHLYHRRTQGGHRAFAGLPAHATEAYLQEAAQVLKADGIDATVAPGHHASDLLIVTAYLPEWLLREIAGEPV